MIRICKYCEKEFKTNHGKKIYCDNCKRDANRKKALERYYYSVDENIDDNVICEMCGKEFIQSKYNRGKKPLCSKECKQENHKIQQKIRWETRYKNKRKYNPKKFNPVKKECLNCGKEIITEKNHPNKSFCSRKCRDKHIQLKNREEKEKEEKFCKNCGKLIIIDKNKSFNTQVIKNFCCYKCRNNYYVTNKLKTDPEFKLITILRRSINRSIIRKKQQTKHYLGADITTVRKHIESLFKDGMTWDNHGLWHLDHITPCKSFDLKKEEEILKCFNYKNFQPLWASENLRKSSNISKINLDENQKERILKRDNNKCFFCKRTDNQLNKLDFTLLKSLMNGGKLEDNNIITICSECKRIKDNRTIESFLDTEYAKNNNIKGDYNKTKN